MSEKTVKIPGPDHPISIEPMAQRVIVTAGGRVIAETTRALSLREASYGPVLYIPRTDADMTALVRSDHMTYCPYKGECHYFSIGSEEGRGTNAVWTYETPYDSVAAIKDHLAFYPDRVDSIVLQPL